MLKAGAPRIDLDGNIAGEVTLEDERAAKLKSAKAERRENAKENRWTGRSRCLATLLTSETAECPPVVFVKRSSVSSPLSRTGVSA
jgi:sRNA-binding protein